MAKPIELYQCKTVAEQKAWILARLKEGRTLTDSGLWLAGVNRPQEVIAALRKDGADIATTRKTVTDAADQKHRDLAWKLAPAATTAAA